MNAVVMEHPQLDAEDARALRRALEREQATQTLVLLSTAKRKAPDLRLGQILQHALSINSDDLWNISDEKLGWRLQTLIHHFDE